MFSKQISKDNEVYEVNLFLELFTPYSVDKSTCRDLLDGVLHSLDKSMEFPSRVRHNTRVPTSTAEIFYGYTEGIPAAIQNKLDRFDPSQQKKLIAAVFQDLHQNYHARSPVKTHLIPYMAQETLSILTDPEAHATFMELMDRYAQVTYALSKLVQIHRFILDWAEEVCRLEDELKATTDESKIVPHVDIVMNFYADYVEIFEDFQGLSLNSKAAIYNQEYNVESDPSKWLNRLELPGFIQGPRIDRLYHPLVSISDFREAINIRFKEILGTLLYQIQPFNNGPGPEATSSRRHSRDHLPSHPLVATASVAPDITTTSNRMPGVTFQTTAT